MNNLRLFNGVYKGKKVLITGDTGFKGSWLSVWLKELGAQVYGYALPAKTEKDNFIRCNLKNIINHKDGDIRDKDSLAKYFQDVHPDLAFHLAAQPLVLESYENPQYTFETNLMGTVNFFESIRNIESVKAAINITSDKCYHNNEWVWGYRENEPMGGDDPYSASKGCSELITNAYQKSFFNKDSNCKIASARAGNVIGGGDWAENRIVPDFFRAMEENNELSIRNPHSTRPWQHVLEPLSGYLWLGAKLYDEGERFSGSWNFGPLETTNRSVIDLINSMSNILGKGQYLIADNKDFHEANLLKLDISKAVKYLEWYPTLDFKETIQFTVSGYIAEIDNSNVYESRIKQIESYISVAKNNEIKWSL
jgi:CDP-glucose 4,6-dehydratase